MPQSAFITSFMQGFEDGRKARADKQKQQQDLEDREFELKQRKAQHALDSLKLQQLRRTLDKENYDFMAGAPGTEMPAPLIPDAVHSLIGMTPNAVLSGQYKPPEPQRTGNLLLPEQTISGIDVQLPEELGGRFTVPSVTRRQKSDLQLKLEQDALHRQQQADADAASQRRMTEQDALQQSQLRNMPPVAPRQDNSLTPFEVWTSQNPDAPISEWFAIQPKGQSGEQGSYMDLRDDQGRVIGAWNPKSGLVKPIPDGFEGARRTPVPSGVNAQIRDFENAARKISDLQTSYKPEFVGPVAGRWEKSKASGVLSYLPFLSTPAGYPQFAALNADLKNSVIKLITGAQMGQQEADRILSQVPTETDKPELWAAKYDTTKKNAEFLLAKTKELSGAGGVSKSPVDSNGWKIISVK